MNILFIKNTQNNIEISHFRYQVRRYSFKFKIYEIRQYEASVKKVLDLQVIRKSLEVHKKLDFW